MYRGKFYSLLNNFHTRYITSNISFYKIPVKIGCGLIIMFKMIKLSMFVFFKNAYNYSITLRYSVITPNIARS